MNKFLIVLLTIAMFVGWTTSANAQTGPAGVGNQSGVNGQPQNLIWVDAQSLNFTNGKIVNSWADKSGNAYDMLSDNTVGTNSPTYITNVINNKNIIRFDNSNKQTLKFHNSFNSEIVNTNYTLFWVAARRNANTEQYVFGGTGTTQDQNLYSGWGYPGSASTPSLCANQINNNCAAPWGSYNTDLSNEFGIISARLDHTSGRILWENGTQRATSSNKNYVATQNNTKLAYRIGQSGATEIYSDVDIAELIFFKTNINDAQRIIVENYLSQKYNIAIANDFYVNSNGFDNDLIGIGTNDGSQKQSNTAGNGGSIYLSEANNSLNTTNEFLMTAHNNAPINITQQGVSSALTSARWMRIWYIQKNGNIDADIKFDLVEAGFSAPTDISNYKLLYRLNNTSDFTEVTVNNSKIVGNKVVFTVDNANLNNGYYTLGVPNSKTWYSYSSGDWDNVDVWTLDPAGIVYENPNNETPTSSSTAEFDNVVVKSGNTVTITANDKKNVTLTVEGQLELGTSTGHIFTKIRGSGRIKLAADNFPNGDATHFISAGQGEGTVVFYGNNNINLSTSHTFFDISLEMDNINATVNLLADYNINGKFNLEVGQFKIGGNTASPSNLTINLAGDCLIGNKANLTVDPKQAAHQFNFGSDLINNGTLVFTNNATPDSMTKNPNYGVVHANFNEDFKNQTIKCNGPSTFYRIEIDKGIDDTYELYISANAPENFKLYGYSNQGHSETAQLSENLNALGLLRGTVRIGPNVNIERLNGKGNYNISIAARLWVDGGSVAKKVTNAIVPYGKIRVTAGLLEADTESGITMRGNSSLTVEGGVVRIRVFRTSIVGADQIGAYIQTGGLVEILGEGITNGSYSVFNLTYPDNVFNMSGGTLKINQGNSRGGIFIACKPGNFNVTGGDVIFDCGHENSDFFIASTSPFWNLTLTNVKNNGGRKHELRGYTTGPGSAPYTLPDLPLTVLNNFTISPNTLFDAHSQDVKIGGDLIYKDGASYPPRNNTTWFIGDKESTINIENSSATNPLELFNLTIAKNNKDTKVQAVRASGATKYFMLIRGDLLVKRGVLDENEWWIGLRGNAELVDGNIVATPDNGVEGKLWINNSTVQTLKSKVFSNQSFGNIRQDNPAGVTLLSDIIVNNFELNRGITNLGTYNMQVEGQLSATNGNFSVSKMLKTAGHAGDGGLTLKITQDGTYLFPLGVDGYYTYAEANISNYQDDGYLQISLNNGELATVGYDGVLWHRNLLSFYWHVKHREFNDNPNVSYRFQSHDDFKLFDYSSGYWAGRVTIPEFNRDADNQINSDFTNNAFVYNDDYSLENADYTAGYKTRFVGKPTIYYSTESGRLDWDDPKKWTEKISGIDDGGAAWDYPHKGDVAVIRSYGQSLAGGIDATNDPLGVHAAAVIFEIHSTDPNAWLPQLKAEEGLELDLGSITGAGIVAWDVTPTEQPSFVNTDITDFVRQPKSEFLFNMVDVGIINMPNNISEYPNVRIEGEGDSKIDIRVLRTSVPINIRGYLNTDMNTYLRVYHDVSIGGSLNFGRNGTNSASVSTLEIGDEREITLEINGDFNIGGTNTKRLNEVFVINDNPQGFNHTVRVGGNIRVGSSMNSSSQVDLYNGTGNNNNATLILNGNTNTEFTNLSASEFSPEFYRVILSKYDERNIFSFRNKFTLEGPTNGDTKALELIKGGLELLDGGIDVTLTSGGADFFLPSTSSLLLNNGAIIRAKGDNTGLRLDGTLHIKDGKALINQGENNYIEYTASRNAAIILDDANSNLQVGSQIRRSLNTESGVLRFECKNAGANILIGTDAVPISGNNRSVFEILNGYSVFSMVANSRLIIRNNVKSSTVPVFNIGKNVSGSVSSSSTIQFGDNLSAKDQEMGINSTLELGNIEINNASGHNPKVKMWNTALALHGNLSIDAGTSFEANDLTLNIGGDLLNNGSFIHNKNYTIFDGNSNQKITGNTEFYNLEYLTSNNLTTESPITVINDLKITHLAGKLIDNGNTITVLHNVDSKGTHIYGGTGDGILLQGVGSQKISSDGTYGKLTINNSNGVILDPITSSSILITNSLKMVRGVLDIRNNLLTLGTMCNIEETNPFSEGNMIQTNLSTNDNGVKKKFNTGTTNFIFPIGAFDKYTPISLNNCTIGGAGNSSITVVAVNKLHTVIADDAEPTCEFNDLENVLHYYWKILAEGTTNFKGDLVFNYIKEDAKVNNSCGLTLADYIPARIRESGITKISDPSLVSISTPYAITYPFSTSVPFGEIGGDYLAGIIDAIPEDILIYETVSDGDWTDGSIWTPQAPGGPRGAIAIVNPEHTVTVYNSGDVLSYITYVNGRLNVNRTTKHTIGKVKGTGTMYLQMGKLPAGDYREFVTETGGTFEFGSTSASADYSVLSAMPQVNNLIFSGKGKRDLPNLNLNILGNLTISGDDNTLRVVNTFDHLIELKKDVVIDNGEFDAGTGATAIFEMNGLRAQTISGTGSFTGTNAFNYFVIDNYAGISHSIPIEISQNLTFEEGIIHNDRTKSLILSNTNPNVVIGANSGHFVDGKVCKEILKESYFNYPIGSSGRYGVLNLSNVNTTGRYCADYYNDNPGNAGYTPESVVAPLQFASNNEYWRTSSSIPATAYVKLRWDEYSGVSSDATEREELRVAKWNTTLTPNAAWEATHTNNTASGSATSGTVTSANTQVAVDNNSIFTIGSTNMIEFEWTGETDNNWNVTTNWSPARIPTQTSNATIPTNPTGNRFPIISTSANIRELTIESSATVTVNPKASLTLNGNFENNGNLILETPNDNTAGGSFIDNGFISGSGKIQVKRFMKSGIFHYIANPVHANQATSALFTRSNPSGNYNPNFLKYDESYDLDGNASTAPAGTFDNQNLVPGWQNAHNGVSGADEQLDPKKGYAFYTDIDQIITFEGTPNTGTVPITGLTHTVNDPFGDNFTTLEVELYDGWNFIANPYPSSLDWTKVNKSMKNIDNGIYVWDGDQYSNFIIDPSTGNGVSGISLTGGAGNLTKDLPPVQGFYVHVNSTEGGSLTLRNTDRVHSTVNYMKGDDEEEVMVKDLLSLSLFANGYEDKINVYFREKATMAYDGRYDAVAMFGYSNTVPVLYTITENSNKMSTNCLPLDRMNNIDVPVGVHLKTAGQVTMKFKEFEGFENINIILEDKTENKMIDLRSNSEYVFNHVAGIVNDRFVLHFNQNTPPRVLVDVEDKVTNEDELFTCNLPENYFIDDDVSDNLSLVLSMNDGQSLVSWLHFDTDTKVLSGTPTNSDVGVYSLRYTATDNFGAKANIYFNIEVLNVNDAPVLETELEDAEMNAFETLDYIIHEKTFGDVDAGDVLSYKVTSENDTELPIWLTFNASEMTLHAAPVNADAGEYNLKVTATDKAGASIFDTFKLTVKSVLSIEENETSVVVSPNPSNGRFIINCPVEEYEFEIIDVTGKVIYFDSSVSNRTDVDISDYAAGVYSVRIIFSDNTSIVKKVTIR